MDGILLHEYKVQKKEKEEEERKGIWDDIYK